MSQVKKNSPFFLLGLVVVAIVIVMDSLIDEFNWVDLVWLATSTVWLQVSACGQLCDYTVRLQMHRTISEK